MISLEVLHRSLVAMVGGFAALGLLTAIKGGPSMKQVLGWWNESTLGLLFGMMVLVLFFCS